MVKITDFLLGDRKYALATELLWVVVVIASVVVLTSLMPQTPNDFWWHLKIGETIFQTGNIPSTNMYSWSISVDTPFVYGAWFGEYLMFTIYNIGGIALLLFVRTLLLAGTLLLVIQQARQRTHSWRLAALAGALSFGMILNNIIVRPQNWSWLPFMLFVLILQAYKSKQISFYWLVLCPLMMVFWVNVHGAYILGVVLCGAYAVGETVRHLLRQNNVLGKSALRWLWLTLGLVILAMLVNPQGIGIIRYVHNLMTDQSSQDLIVEWQSPSPSGLPNIVFYGSILILLVVMWFSKRVPDLTDMLIVLGFTWLAWSGMRYVMWYALVVTPILVDYMRDLIPEKYVVISTQRNLLNNIIAVCVCIPVILVMPWFVNRVIRIMPDSYTNLLSYDLAWGPMQSVETPTAVVEFLRTNPVDPMYHEMGYGSFFIWALPEHKVFTDPRVELYPYTVWLDYIRIMKGIRYNQLLDQYGVNRIVLDVERQEELMKSLELDDGWIQVYADIRTQVWDRR